MSDILIIGGQAYQVVPVNTVAKTEAKPEPKPPVIRACLNSDPGPRNTRPLFKVKYKSRAGNVEVYGVASDTITGRGRRLWLRKLTKKSGHRTMAKCTRYAKGFSVYLDENDGIQGEA